MDKTTLFNVVATVLAIIMPILTEAGYTGNVPVEWAVFVTAAIAVINAILKYISKTEVGQAYNV